MRHPFQRASSRISNKECGSCGDAAATSVSRLQGAGRSVGPCSLQPASQPAHRSAAAAAASSGSSGSSPLSAMVTLALGVPLWLPLDSTV